MTAEAPIGYRGNVVCQARAVVAHHAVCLDTAYSYISRGLPVGEPLEVQRAWLKERRLGWVARLRPDPELMAKIMTLHRVGRDTAKVWRRAGYPGNASEAERLAWVEARKTLARELQRRRPAAQTYQSAGDSIAPGVEMPDPPRPVQPLPNLDSAVVSAVEGWLDQARRFYRAAARYEYARPSAWVREVRTVRIRAELARPLPALVRVFPGSPLDLAQALRDQLAQRYRVELYDDAHPERPPVAGWPWRIALDASLP